VPGLEREEFRGATGGNDGGVRVTPGGFGLSGPHAGRGWEFSRASSALPRSKARFELLSRARLRAVFGGRWAVPSWPDPTYQTRKSAKIWGEMGNSLSAQPTKHAHSMFQNNEATIPNMSNRFCKMESRPQTRVDEHPGMRTSKVGPCTLHC
jgi:hypothetical protein